MERNHDILNAIFESAATGMALLDLEGHVVHSNPALRKMLGYSEEALRKMKVQEYTHPDDIIKDLSLVQELLEGKRTSYQIDKRYIHKKGYLVWGRLTVTLLKTKPGHDAGETFLGMLEDVSYRKQLDEELQQERDFIETVLNTIGSLLVVLNPQGRILRFNRAMETLTGYTLSEVKGRCYWDIFLERQEIELARAFFENISPEDLPFTMENEWIMKDGSTRLILWSNTALLDDEGMIGNFIWTGTDITEQKQSEEALVEANERLSTLIHASPLAVISLDSRGRVTSWSSAAENLFGWTEQEVLGQELPMLPAGEQETFYKLYEEVMLGRSFTELEVCYRRKDGTPVEISLSTAPLRNKIGDVTGIMLIALDITERRQAEEKIRYLSFHDKVTGLYNRAYFEEELNRLDTPRQLPLSMIIADVNGLKLVNDAFGHQDGDRLLVEAARIIKESSRKEDIVCRWGGDEFAVLLPRTFAGDVEKIITRIKTACNKCQPDPIELSIALGSATKTSPEMNMHDVIKKAETEMYNQKILEAREFRAQVISSLLKSLGKKSYENEEHTWRMQALAVNLGDTMGLDDTLMDDLVLAVSLHDIGKLAISERILLKPGPLAPDEWEIIKEHPEKGYHITLASGELARVARIILSHHEHWDGSGYPQCLAGEEIPLLSRLISIIDAYDVMTHSQVYKQPISPREALKEIERCSGSQFDPCIAGVFIQMMQKVHQEEERLIKNEQDFR